MDDKVETYPADEPTYGSVRPGDMLLYAFGKTPLPNAGCLVLSVAKKHEAGDVLIMLVLWMWSNDFELAAGIERYEVTQDLYLWDDSATLVKGT